jgi:hypothetical protein
MNTNQLRQYVQLSIAEKLGEFSIGFFECNCFAAYLQLANDNTEFSSPAKEILAEYEWDDCPEPRCPECNDELYRSIQDWMLPIVTGELNNTIQNDSQTAKVK